MAFEPPRWLIVYDDGTLFWSHDGGPEDAPPLGVLGIIQIDSGERQLVYKFHLYWWREDERVWYGGDDHGWHDQAMNLGARWLKQGRSVLTDRFEALIGEALRVWEAAE